MVSAVSGFRQIPAVKTGAGPGEVEADAEGMQTMRNVGHNLAWLMKCIEAGKQAGIALPATERGARTNFVR